MPDPIHDLENLSQGTPVNPLPASEVRRRGARLRRRNHALAVAAGVAAVAVVATPLALVANRSTPSTPQPAGPVQTWRQHVPADFPLADGLPATNADDGTPLQVRARSAHPSLELCTVAWTPDRPVAAVDVAGVGYDGETEGGLDRTLALYADDRQAARALEGVRTAVQDCPEVPGSDQRLGARYEAADSVLGPQSLVYTARSTDGAGLNGEMTVYQLVQVGNALLIDSADSLGAGDPAVVDDAVGMVRERSAGVVADLCLFSAEGCGPGDPAQGEGSGSASGGQVPADFPLTSGYPDTNGDGSPVSATDEGGFDETAWCGAEGFDPALPVDVLGARYTGEAEETRGRTLALYADVGTAREAFDRLESTLGRCDVESTGGTDRVYARTPYRAGDDSFAVTRRYRDGDAFVTGLDVLQVVRVGSALYLGVVSGEGGGTDESTQQAADAMAHDSQPVVEAMCVFRDGGC